MNIEFNECYFKINNTEMVVEHPISDARTDGKYVYVIYDYSDFPNEYQANNLECFNEKAEPVWCAEHPTNLTNSAYTNFIAIEPKLIVGNFSGYNVTINKENGRVLNAEFTK